MRLFFVLCFFVSLPLFSEEAALTESSSVTSHTALINGAKISYKATAGTILLRDEKGAPKGSMFYVAYMKEDAAKRPITFCFNGGPGSSSIWLHLGLLGPKRVALKEEGYALPPYALINNDYSLLDATDLVFIDPISTGFSKAAPGVDAKQFHGVDEDIQSIGDFIRIFLTKFNLWDAPKFLAGESYGTTRAAGLSAYLHDHLNIYLNGIILISSVLNFQTLDTGQLGNDLPYFLSLPSFTATAWYHNKLGPNLQKRPLLDLLKEVEAFAQSEYALALTQGDLLPSSAKKQLIQKLSAYTGLSEEVIAHANMRIDLATFITRLLYAQNRIVGIYDGRFQGIFTETLPPPSSDPTSDAITGAFTATFNQYVRTTLGYQSEDLYQILADVSPWNYGKNTNQYLNFSATLADVLSRNTTLRIFVASGYYDLVTPYFATNYTFNHLNLDPQVQNHITFSYYPAGHMMYLYKPSLIQLKQDLAAFIAKTLKQEHSSQDSPVPPPPFTPSP